MLDLSKEIVASDDSFEVKIISTDGGNEDYPIVAEFKKKGTSWWYSDHFSLEGMRACCSDRELCLINSDPFKGWEVDDKIIVSRHGYSISFKRHYAGNGMYYYDGKTSFTGSTDKTSIVCSVDVDVHNETRDLKITLKGER